MLGWTLEASLVSDGHEEDNTGGQVLEELVPGGQLQRARRQVEETLKNSLPVSFSKTLWRHPLASSLPLSISPPFLSMRSLSQLPSTGAAGFLHCTSSCCSPSTPNSYKLPPLPLKNAQSESMWRKSPTISSCDDPPARAATQERLSAKKLCRAQITLEQLMTKLAVMFHTNRKYEYECIDKSNYRYM